MLAQSCLGALFVFGGHFSCKIVVEHPFFRADFVLDIEIMLELGKWRDFDCVVGLGVWHRKA